MRDRVPAGVRRDDRLRGVRRGGEELSMPTAEQRRRLDSVLDFQASWEDWVAQRRRSYAQDQLPPEHV